MHILLKLAAASMPFFALATGCSTTQKNEFDTDWSGREEMREDASIVGGTDEPERHTEEDSPTHIEPGRRPEKSPAVTIAPDRIAQRPEDVIGRLDVPLNRQWKYIVIHHSGAGRGNARIFDRWHKQRGWDGVGYDFVIGNGNGQRDGAVEVTFRWTRQRVGAHAGVKQYNQHGIGICLVGDFEASHPTRRQLESLVSLVSYLQRRCKIPNYRVLGHRHVKNTKCPGKNFPYYRILALLPQ